MTIENVLKYNSIILGIQNYYRIANQSYKDFSDIAYILSRTLYNKTNKIRGSTGKQGSLYKKLYGHSKRKIIYIAKTELFPLSVTKFKMPTQFNPDICNYTKYGREKIHNNLKGINRNTITFLLRNPDKNESVEYNDNRISLYVGQNGKDYITKKTLHIGKMKVHHKKPKNLGGDDSYKNLILVSDEIHKLIHATQSESIKKYLEIEKLNKEEIEKLNQLRIKIGNYSLEITNY